MPHLYFQNLMLGLDEFANTLVGGAPGETISGRAGRARDNGWRWGKVLCFILDKIEKNHCSNAILNDTKGRHRESLKIE